MNINQFEIEEARLNQLLQTQLKTHSYILGYFYCVFIWERPKDFVVWSLLILGFFGFLMWMETTILAAFCIILNIAVWLWWCLDSVQLNLPWQKILTKNFDVEVFGFLAWVICHIESIYQLLLNIVNKYPSRFVYCALGCFISLSLIGLAINNTFLMFLFLCIILCSPRFLNKYYMERKKKQS